MKRPVARTTQPPRVDGAGDSPAPLFHAPGAMGTAFSGARAMRADAACPAVPSGGSPVLAKVWEASGYLCSQRLKAALPQWLPWIKKHFKVNGELEKELLTVSAPGAPA